MTKREQIMKILEEFYNPKQMEIGQYNWNDYFPKIADAILASIEAEPDLQESKTEFETLIKKRILYFEDRIKTIENDTFITSETRENEINRAKLRISELKLRLKAEHM